MFQAIFLFVLLNLFKPHPIHVSVNEVGYGEGKMEWTARIYKDDLLLALYGKNVSIDEMGENVKIEDDILKYLSKHIVVSLDESKLTWTLLEIQPDPEAIWITLHADLPHSSISTIGISNNVLMDVYKDQKNVVNLKLDTKTKSIVFEKGDKEKKLTL